LTDLAVKAALILALGVGGYEGYAARYGAGVMGRVADNRGIARSSCMVALTSARTITGDQWVWVLGRKTGKMRHCKIVDLPQDEDRAGLQERGIVTELDRESARDVCGGVTEPPRKCPVIVWEE
jgi:hypothetical protein